MVKWAAMQQSQVLAKIFKRTFIIFLCGYLLYWFPFVELDKTGHLILSPLSNTRILGVLQRIALAYCIASLLLYFGKPKTAVIICVIILLLYWPVMYWFGDAADAAGSLTGNAGLKFDRWLMGENHMLSWRRHRIRSRGMDQYAPGGRAMSLPALLPGNSSVKKAKPMKALLNCCWPDSGCWLSLISGVSASRSAKKLWSSSFVLYTVGLDCIILSAVIYVIDFLKKTRWTYFFEVFGKNPLFIYLLSEVGATVLYVLHTSSHTPVHTWIYEHIFKSAGPYFGSLLFAVAFMLFCWLVGLFLDKKRIYVRF